MQTEPAGRPRPRTPDRTRHRPGRLAGAFLLYLTLAVLFAAAVLMAVYGG